MLWGMAADGLTGCPRGLPAGAGRARRSTEPPRSSDRRRGHVRHDAGRDRRPDRVRRGSGTADLHRCRHQRGEQRILEAVAWTARRSSRPASSSARPCKPNTTPHQPPSTAAGRSVPAATQQPQREPSIMIHLTRIIHIMPRSARSLSAATFSVGGIATACVSPPLGTRSWCRERPLTVTLNTYVGEWPEAHEKPALWLTLRSVVCPRCALPRRSTNECTGSADVNHLWGGTSTTASQRTIPPNGGPLPSRDQACSLIIGLSPRLNPLVNLGHGTVISGRGVIRRADGPLMRPKPRRRSAASAGRTPAPCHRRRDARCARSV